MLHSPVLRQRSVGIVLSHPLIVVAAVHIFPAVQIFKGLKFRLGHPVAQALLSLDPVRFQAELIDLKISVPAVGLDHMAGFPSFSPLFSKTDVKIRRLVFQGKLRIIVISVIRLPFPVQNRGQDYFPGRIRLVVLLPELSGPGDLLRDHIDSVGQIAGNAGIIPAPVRLVRRQGGQIFVLPAVAAIPGNGADLIQIPVQKRLQIVFRLFPGLRQSLVVNFHL